MKIDEFNKKSNEEILKIKRKSLIILTLVTIFFFPIIFIFSLSLLVSFFEASFRGLCISLLILVPFLLIYKEIYRVYGSYLIYGKDVEVEGLDVDLKKDRVLSKETGKENIDGYVLKNEPYHLTEAEVLDKILKVDKDFSKTHFYSYTKSLFILIQEAWSNNDYHKLRFFEDDRLFFSHKNEIIDLINSKQKDIRDNIHIKGVLLKDFRIENNKEILIVAITAKMRRIFNFEENEYTYPYIMAFSRNVGVKTNPNIELSTTNCSNCGAVIKVSDDGICNYCNTSLISGEHEWVLVDLKLINKK